MFVAAMTTNQGLRSDLIKSVFNGANNSALPGVPVYYDSRRGQAVQGVLAR